MNCDGSINSIDAALILQRVVGFIDLLACQENASLNGNSTASAILAMDGLGYTFASEGDQPPRRETTAQEGIPDTSAVIGVDERVQITDTTEYPQRAIAQLELYKSGAYSGACTGTFIGPDTLITAAHCLYDPVDGWTGDIAVVPGKDGAFEPYGYEWAAQLTVSTRWIDGDPDFDWGFIKMPTEVMGNTVGWFTIANLTDRTLARTDFTPAIVGYPGDQPIGTMWGSFKDAFLTVHDFTLEYDIDTAPGQSGSAIFSINVNEWFGAYVVGIHTRGGPAGNLGQRIDAVLLDGLLTACSRIDCTISYFVESQAAPTPAPPPAAFSEHIADVNGDSNISAVDAALILQYVAGLISSLPP